ncbi:UBN2_3 domain-containing protein, partial [Cephalotus follicularis]
YITGTAVPPEESSDRYRTWKVENHMVMSWLLNSMTIEMGENFMYYQTAKEIWDATRETYSNKDNTSAIFEIKGILHDLRQGEMTITYYFNALTRYWQQLDMLEDIKWHCPEDTQQYKKIVEKERIYKFLLGLNKELDEVRGRILSIKPLPSVREVFSEVRREESRGKVMLGLGTTTLTSTESSALVTNRGQNFSNIQQWRNNKPWCEHCRQTGHTKDSCWKLHGKPTDWKPRTPQERDNRGNCATAETLTLSPTEHSPFNKDQMDLLQKLLQESVQSALNPKVASTTQKGKLPTVFCARRGNIEQWIVDSEASDHMTGDSSLFSTSTHVLLTLQFELLMGLSLKLLE